MAYPDTSCVCYPSYDPLEAFYNQYKAFEPRLFSAALAGRGEAEGSVRIAVARAVDLQDTEAMGTGDASGT